MDTFRIALTFVLFVGAVLAVYLVTTFPDELSLPHVVGGFLLIVCGLGFIGAVIYWIELYFNSKGIYF